MAHEFSRQVVKPCFRELRPRQSLSSKPWSFPSNHATVSTLELVLMLNYIWIENLPPIHYWIPLVCCFPVLPARSILMDHTVQQVAVGAAVGGLLGLSAIVLGL